MTRRAMLRVLVVVTAAAAAVAPLLFGSGRESWRDVLCALACTANPPAETTAAAVDLEPPAVDAPDFAPQMQQKLVLLAGELEAARRSGGIEYRPAAGDSPGADTGPFSHAYAYFGRACDGLGWLNSAADGEEARQVRSDVVCSYRAVLRVLEVATARDDASSGVAETDQPSHDTTVAPEVLERHTETAASGS